MVDGNRIRITHWPCRGMVFVRWTHGVPDYWRTQGSDPSEWFWEEGKKKKENSFIRERHLGAEPDDIRFALMP